MAIPREFIDELLDRTDIVELIGSRVSLKRRGVRHVACCPFHKEKTPSFTVNAQKQFYYCFGCRASGTAIDFLMRLDGLDFVSAVQQLAAQCGLELPSDRPGDSKRHRRFRMLADILDDAAHFYRQCLRENRKASEYVEGRGISEEVASQMRIGYAPEGWTSLQEHFGDRYASADLAAVGLIKPSSKGRQGHYDAFRDRLIFPIRNQRGQTIGFGGRALDSDEPAKYINTQETDLFRKKSEVYGLYEALHPVEKGHAAIEDMYLVEGYMDVVSMKCHGIDSAVACMGTAVSRIQLQKILKKCKRLVFCFDGDDAGREAAWRATNELLPIIEDKDQIALLFLPQGEDPDSWLRQHGAEGWREYQSQNCMEIDDFFFRRISNGRNSSNLSDRVAYARQVVSLCGAIKSQLYRRFILDALATRANMDSAALLELIESSPKATKHIVAKPQGQSSKIPIEYTRWNDFLSLQLAYPTLIDQIQDNEKYLHYFDRHRQEYQENSPNGCLQTLIDSHARQTGSHAHQLLGILHRLANPATNEEGDKDAGRDEASEQCASHLLELAMGKANAMEPDIYTGECEPPENAVIEFTKAMRKFEGRGKYRLEQTILRSYENISLDELSEEDRGKLKQILEGSRYRKSRRQPEGTVVTDPDAGSEPLERAQSG